MDLEGFIALQVHAGKEGVIRWKNVRIKDLGRSEWKPLWDGKTLDGWTPTGGGHWAIEDGDDPRDQRLGRPEARPPVLAADEYGDFAVRLKFLSKQGNSGLYFRAEEAGSLGIRGFQAEIDPANDVGGLYETEGRGWVVQPKPEDVKKWLKPGRLERPVGRRARRPDGRPRQRASKSAEVVDPQGPEARQARPPAPRRPGRRRPVQGHRDPRRSARRSDRP